MSKKFFFHILFFSISVFYFALAQTKFEKYVVKPKDTLYSLGKTFSISIEQLKEINPKLRENQLLEGMILDIPKVDLNSEEAQEEDEFIIYYVNPGDNLLSILNKYEISFEEIMLYNPFLKEGLKKGIKLKIPSKKYLSSSPFLPKKDGINIVLMLPLFLDKEEKEGEKQIKNEANCFYLGALHAIEEVREKKSVYLKVFDTQNDKNKIDKFLNTYNFSFIHGLIGPLFRSSIEQVAKGLKGKNIPVLSPFSASDLLDKYPNVFQAKVKDKYLIDPIVEEIKKSTFNASKIYLLGPHWKRENLNYFKSKFENFEKEIVYLKEFLEFPENEEEDFFAIFLQAEDKSDTLDDLFINFIKNFPKEKISPLAIGYSDAYYKNREILKKYNFTFSTKNYFNVELENSTQKKSILELKSIACEAEKYKYMGYDFVYDFLSRLSMERNLLNKFSDFIYKGILNKCDYKKLGPNKSHVNRGVWMVRFLEKQN